MPATPISNPATGESLVGIEPQLLQQSPSAGWRRRLNLFTGRALSVSALDNEQLYRSGLLSTLGQSVTPGTVKGLAATLNTGAPDALISVTPGYGIMAGGFDVILNQTLKTALSTLPVIAAGSEAQLESITASDQAVPWLTLRQHMSDPTNKVYAGFLLLRPVIAQVSGAVLDTGSQPVIVSGNLAASCGQDPTEAAFEDWQIADALQLVYMPWPTETLQMPTIAPPPAAPPATWRNQLAYTIFAAEALLGPDDQLPWNSLGVPVALIGFNPGGAWQANTPYAVGQLLVDANSNRQVVTTAGISGGTVPGSWNSTSGGTTTDGGVVWTNSGVGWQPLFLDCSAVVRGGGLPRRRYSLPAQATQPALAQARINQLSEQLAQTLAAGTTIGNLSALFATLPPSGILPVSAVNFANASAPWMPPNWSLTAAPVRLEELEAVLETGMLTAPLPVQTTAPADPTTLEPVELLVPLPDAAYDPNILVVETVAPIFTQELDGALSSRNLTLQRLLTVDEEVNVLLTGIGPNSPATRGLIDPDAGLTQDEIAGRDVYPPYLPGPTETFSTVLSSSWTKGTNYPAGAFVIDGNGAVQVVTTAGASGATAPAWNSTVGATTADNTVTWLNNGPWTWQPNTSYAVGQFVIDTKGNRFNVSLAGTSAASAPAWNETAGSTTQDGVIWQPCGQAIWQPDTLYAVGAVIFDSRKNIQIVQTAGISGDDPPPWIQTPGLPTQDSGVTWKNLGNAAWASGTGYAAGQAIVDSGGQIQLVSVGGTSGTTQPQWSEAPGTTTLDAAIKWTNAGTLIWQPGTAYVVGALALDPNGGIQMVKTAGTSGATAPTWAATPSGVTTDNTVQWSNNSFVSIDIQTLLNIANQAPYVVKYTDSSNTAQTINLLSATDIAQLSLGGNGLQSLVNSLSSRIAAANDLLDTGFLTTQTDIYRYRQNVLGATAATSLATSTVLANIATGSTATATATDLQSYLSTLSAATPPPPATTTTSTSQPASTTTPTTSGTSTVFSVYKPVVSTPIPVSLPTRFLATAVKTPATPLLTIPAAATQASAATAAATQTTATRETAIVSSALLTATPVQVTSSTLNRINPVSVFQSPVAESSFIQTAAAGLTTTLSPTGISTVRAPNTFTSTDITGQLPIAGAELDVRTLTVAQRLQQSPSQEAMYYSIANRLSFLQTLATICAELDLTVDDLPILSDTQYAAGTTPPAAGNPVPVKSPAFTFGEWRAGGPATTSIQQAIQNPYVAADAAEATLFSVGIRVTEQHTIMMRGLEARVQQYSDFLTLCKSALSNMQANIAKARTYLTQLGNTLHQNRQDVAFTTALYADEKNRVAQVNAQRQQVLQNAVQLVAYTRARTLEATDTVASRQLEPANITNPVPACIQQSVAIPAELREIIGQLREAPINWLPAVAALMPKLERPTLLLQLAQDAQSRAVLQLQSARLPSSSAGNPGTYATAISRLYDANQDVFQGLKTQRAAAQPGSLVSLSWSLQVATVQSMAALNDLMTSEAVHAEITHAVAKAIQQISNVATCLYTRASIALPIDRLAWAEYLSGRGMSVGLRSLAVLPNWNDLSYTDRQQMQMLVDWLFLQIDSSISAAVAFMSDVVRTAILLASDVPVDNVVPAGIIQRAQPTVGGVVSLSLPSTRIGSGMFVQLYSGSTLAARAVVTDLDSSSVSATVTDVYQSNVYLETTDTAHITAQNPRAVALRPLFS